MTQPLASDFPIDPVVTSGTALADILNRFADSVGTNNSGATAPPDTMPGMFWLDTSSGANGTLKMRNAANTGWITISTPGGVSMLADGTVAAPGLAWSSEPGLGWYRKSAGVFSVAASGSEILRTSRASATDTFIDVFPSTAGRSILALWQQPGSSANNNVIGVANNTTGYSIGESLVGAAAAKPLALVFPAGVNVSNAMTVGNVNSYGFLGSSSALTKTQMYFGSFDSSSGTNFNVTSNCDLGGGIVMTVANHTPGVSGNYQIRIFNTTTFQFDNAGSAKKGVAGPWDAISDARIKERIEDYTTGLDAVLALRPRWFSFKAETGQDTTKRHVSLIAQEAEVPMPDTVTAAPGKMGDIELDDMRTFGAGNITYALVNAVKTLHERLTQLEEGAAAP